MYCTFNATVISLDKMQITATIISLTDITLFRLISLAFITEILHSAAQIKIKISDKTSSVYQCLLIEQKY